MEPKVTVLTLGVRSLEISRRFYVEGLGWKPLVEVEGEVIFIQVAGGQVLALWSVDELAREAGSVGHSAKAPPIAIGHNVDSAGEVAAVLKEAVAAGATLIRKAGATDWGGTNGYFADPDGFRWEVAHNSGFRVTADGRVHMGPTTD
ncbi:MAG: VOC family protein [Solirubrobacterales bacterium]|nr:VOC family protein [Solirubrobacterales bacterium]